MNEKDRKEQKMRGMLGTREQNGNQRNRESKITDSKPTGKKKIIPSHCRCYYPLSPACPPAHRPSPLPVVQQVVQLAAVDLKEADAHAEGPGTRPGFGLRETSEDVTGCQRV